MCPTEDIQPDRSPPRVPMLLFIGPPSSGKSSAAREAAQILDDAGIAYALVDRDEFGTNGILHEDPLLGLNELLHGRVQEGAQRLIVAWRVESGLELARVCSALDWAEITVCRLRAEQDVLLERIAAGQPNFQSLHLQAMALEIAPRLELQVDEDILLSTDDTLPRAVAMRALRQWSMRRVAMTSEPARAPEGEHARLGGPAAA